MKVTVIGGGSTYTPELVNGLLNISGSFPVDQLCLMDIDPQRLQIVGSFAKRFLEAHNSPFKIKLETDLNEAVKGSSYVITQFRVGMMAARINDEYLGRRHGLIGQETTGVGGMAKALRTIPVILEIASQIRQHAPEALLVNFTNPAGLVTEALSQYAPGIRSVGVCNVAITTKMEMLKLMEEEIGTGIHPDAAELDTLGLNHLTWHRGLKVLGEEIWPKVLGKFIQSLTQADDPEWDPELIRTIGMIPNYYLHYFYNTLEKLTEQASWPPSRGEEVTRIEKRLLERYLDPGQVALPEDLMERGGAWYSTMAARLINAHHNDLGEIHVANVRQAGAVPGWPDDWVLELPCRVDKNGISPLPAEPLPPACYGLISAVKAFERHTVEAAVHGDHNEAKLALLAHPLGPPAHKIPQVWQDILETNKPFFPQFTNV